MAEINLSITSSAEDGHYNGTEWQERTGSYTAHHYFEVGEQSGTDTLGGVRFTGVTIDQGTTITSATLTGVVYGNSAGGSSKSLQLDVFGDDVDNAPAWSASSHPGSGFTETTASASQTLGSGTRDQGDSVAWTITSIIQELVDRGGWSNGNAVRFKIERNSGSPTYNEIRFYDYDTDTLSSIFTLDIVYSDGGVTGTGAGTLSAIAGSASGTYTPASATGTAAGDLEAVTGSASGTYTAPPITGTGAGVLELITGSASGTGQVVSGSASGTLSLITGYGQAINLDPGWEQIVFSGNTPPVDEKSLAREVLVDYPAIPEVVAGDIFGVESHADITWDTDTQAVIDPNGAHELGYWFIDVSSWTTYQSTITLNLYQGSAVGTLSPVTGAVSGLSKEFVGQGSGTLQTVTGSASGGVGGMFGTGDGVLEAITAVGVGGFTTSSVYGGAAATLEAITSSASGDFGPTGSAAGLLQAVIADASGINTTSVIGVGSGVLSSVTGDAVGTVPLDYVVLSTHKLVVPYEDNLLRVN